VLKRPVPYFVVIRILYVVLGDRPPNDTVFEFAIELLFNEVQVKNLKKNEFRYPVFSYRDKICSVKDNRLKIEN